MVKMQKPFLSFYYTYPPPQLLHSADSPAAPSVASMLSYANHVKAS